MQMAFSQLPQLPLGIFRAVYSVFRTCTTYDVHSLRTVANCRVLILHVTRKRRRTVQIGLPGIGFGNGLSQGYTGTKGAKTGLFRASVCRGTPKRSAICLPFTPDGQPQADPDHACPKYPIPHRCITVSHLFCTHTSIPAPHIFRLLTWSLPTAIRQVDSSGQLRCEAPQSCLPKVITCKRYGVVRRTRHTVCTFPLCRCLPSSLSFALALFSPFLSFPSSLPEKPFSPPTSFLPAYLTRSSSGDVS